MFYTVYQLTNLVNDKTYVGVHKTNDLSDSYMGSGKMIKRAISKHGLNSFKKEYLAIFDNADDMFALEAEIVTQDFVDRKDTYNLKEGGLGGWTFVNSTGKAVQSNLRLGPAAIAKLIKDDLVFRARHIEACKKPHLLGKIKYDTFTGRKHTEETKRKIGATNSARMKINNPQSGKCWISKDVNSIMVHKSELDRFLQEGWSKGRKMYK
jgi:hypothetical protein